jgi:rod shape-determining protein MreD
MCMSNSLQRFEEIGRTSLPVGTCLLFLMLIVVPWPIPMVKIILSVFPLMTLCFWVINRPEHFSMAWSFIIGFLQDVLLGQPLGVTALAYLAADFFLRGQRQFFLQQSFQHLWMMFAIVIIGVSTVQWLVVSWVMHGWVDLLPVLLRVVVGVLFFPLMTMLLHYVQRALFSRV